MKVIIDGRCLTKRPTGIATYTISVIQAVCMHLPDWELVVALPQPVHSTIKGLPMGKFKIIVAPLWGCSKLPRFLWYQLKFPFLAKKENVDLIWGVNVELPLIHFNKIKRLITVHDVVWKEFPDTMIKSAKYVNIPFLDRSIINADFIICNSLYTKQKVKEYFPQRKCIKIEHGDSYGNQFRRLKIDPTLKKEIVSHFRLTDDFLLFVGSLEPRKNLSFLLSLMPDIYGITGLKLLVVGGSGWKNSNIFKIVHNNQSIRESVVFADYVSFDKLVELYNVAICYISTSLNEGFGMSQLEAMACGCPVISPHNSAMIEVVEGRGITIEGWNRAEWINKIVQVVKNKKYREQFLQPDLTDYNWSVIIKRYDNFIKNNFR